MQEVVFKKKKITVSSNGLRTFIANESIIVIIVSAHLLDHSLLEHTNSKEANCRKNIFRAVIGQINIWILNLK